MIFGVCAFFAVLAVGAIFLYMLVNGIPAIRHLGLKNILFGTVWKPVAENPEYGILYIILTSLLGTVLAALAGVPIGVLTAVYLAEVAEPGRAVLVRDAVEVLAGIPSVIFGLFGMVFFGNVLGLGYSLANGALTCALMVLPLVVGNTRTALEAVPDGYRQGALGLGATKIYMIRTILLPAAGNGILTGVILAVGRIAGESAALLFTAGSARFLWKQKAGIWESIAGFRDKIFTSGGTLTVELYLQMQKGEYGMAFAIACVLMGMIFLMNFLLKLVCANGKQ